MHKKRSGSSFEEPDHKTGDNLLSHHSGVALPLAVEGLTSVFEMGTCVSPHLYSPDWLRLGTCAVIADTCLHWQKYYSHRHSS